MAAPDVDALKARMDAADTEDFGAFWAEQDRAGAQLRNVFGVDLTLPVSMPLRFDLEAKRLAESVSPDDTRRMVALMFGGLAVDTTSGDRLDEEALLDVWTERGMDAEQFSVLLLWGAANLRGTTITLVGARAELAKAGAAKDDPGGKVPTLGVSSASTGGSSKRTSRASTNSTKRR